MSLSRALWTALVTKSSESSVAGLNRAAKSRSAVRSAVWLSIFGVLMFLTVRGIWKTVVDFNSHPFITSTDLSFEPLVTFPAVTVCNHNRYVFTRLEFRRHLMLVKKVHFSLQDQLHESDRRGDSLAGPAERRIAE